MTFGKTVLVAAGLAFVGAASASPARGQDVNQKTILTFSQPFEIPGHVLPAGSYTFQLVDSANDRHVVQVLNADGSRQIALVMAVPNYRLTPTDKTVISFNEALVGQPETIRAWFYPGRSVGQEFVYPKRRALELAAVARVPVAAIAVDTPDPDLKTVAIVAITPERREVPLATVIQTRPMADQNQTLASAGQSQRRQLPRTASSLPLIAMLGFVCLGLATMLWYRRTGREPAVIPVK